MHGKVMIYINATGRGTVVNLAKSLFEFGNNAWHDKKTMPAVGMLVEYRADGKFITSIRPSKFQSFEEDSFLKERDFWKTEDDKNLEDLQQGRIDEHIQNLYRLSDFDNYTGIESTVDVKSAIAKYFHHEKTLIASLKQIDQSEFPAELDFFVIKRFLSKAFDTLLFTDSRISRESFADTTNTMSYLEYMYTDLKAKQKMLNLEDVYQDTFLRVQYHYQALVFAIDNRRNKRLALERKVKSVASEIKMKQARLETLKGQALEQMQEQIEKKIAQLATLKQNFVYYDKNVASLEATRKDFYDKNFAIFKAMFTKVLEGVFLSVRKGLNICASKLDMQIWQAALKSTAVKNAFVRSNYEFAFCAASFASMYLGRLNANLLNKADTTLSKYIDFILSKKEKKFIIITQSLEVFYKMKTQCFLLSPYNTVRHAPKKVNYLAFLKENEFDFIYIDEKSAWDSAADIILESKQFFKKDSKTKFKII